MNIVVTPEDIACGKPGLPGMCPIAIAVRRAFKAPGASVGYESASVYTEGYGSTLDYRMPKEASEFVYRFDRGWSVRPFSFVLDEHYDTRSYSELRLK